MLAIGLVLFGILIGHLVGSAAGVQKGRREVRWYAERGVVMDVDGAAYRIVALHGDGREKKVRTLRAV